MFSEGSYGQIQGHDLFILEPWEGMAWWFLILPGNDSKCMRGCARSYHEALAAMRRALLAEVKNEQSPRSSS